MARQGTVLLVLGGVLAVGMAAVIWAVMGAEDSADAGAAESPAVTPDVSAEAAKRTDTGAKRTKRAGTASIAGEVRRTKGKAPVAGQEVQLLPERGDPWTVKTDDRGAFRLAELPHGGPHELRVAAPGCGTVRIPGIALDRNEKRDVGTLWLDPSVSVTVEVRSFTDAFVEGAVVEAFAAPQSVDFDWSKAQAQAAQVPVPVARLTTDATGRAVFAELAVGRWTFTAAKEGYARTGRSNVWVRSDVEQTPVKLYFGAGHPLSGRVTDAAKTPVSGAQVMAGPPASQWDPTSSALRSRATADAEGRYAFTSLEAGDTLLWVARTGSVPAVVATLKIPNVKQFDITLKGLGTVEGTVTAKIGEEAAKPVEGAKVRAMTWGQYTTMAEATTDAAGHYAIAVNEGMISQVIAEKEGLVPTEESARYQQMALREGDTLTRDLVMRAGATLSGVIKGPDGPLAGARVWIHFGGQNRGFNQKAVTADADGRYEVASLEPGKVMVRPEKEGFYIKDFPDNWWTAMQQPNAAVAYKVDVTAGVAVTKDVEMSPGVAVEGRVDGTEGPLPGVRIYAAGSTSESGVVTGADGVFRVEGVKPSPNVSLAAMKEGWSLVGNKPFPLAEGTPATGIVLRMTKSGVVRGIVTSADGTALADAQVRVSAWQEGNDNRMQFAEQMPGPGSPVRPDGSFELPLAGWSAGKFRVTASALGRSTATSEPVAVAEGQAEYVVNLTLDRGRTLDGLVMSKLGGAPVAGALVSIQQRQTGRSGDRMRMSGMSGNAPTVWAVADAQGVFSVANLAPATYDVTATSAGFVQGSASVDLAAATRVTVEMEQELTIDGVVVYTDGKPVEGANINSKRQDPDATKRPAGAGGMGGMSGGGGFAMTGKGGSFRITALTAGSYVLGVSSNWNGDVNVRQKDSDPIVAGATGVKIVVESGGVISGRVLDSQRQPAANANINARPDQKDPKFSTGTEWRNAQTKSDGTFSLVGLGAGPYVVSVSSSGWGGTNFKPAERPGVAVGTMNLEIVLEDGMKISGVLVDAEGKPLANTQLQCQGAGGGSNTSTAADGTFTLAGLSEGECNITIAEWGGSANSGLVIENGMKIPTGTEALRLVASKGLTITGVVVDENGGALKGARVFTMTKSRDRSRSAMTKEDGTFEVTGLAPGVVYTLTANATGRAAAKLEGVAPGSADSRLICLKGLTSSGRILDESDAPIASTQITFSLASDPSISQSAQTDADGNFTVAGLADGVYSVYVHRARGGNQPAWPTLKAGEIGVTLKPNTK